MTVKAKWARPELPVATDDPFADGPDVTHFDLRDPQAVLQELFHQESELADAGVECDLKWQGQTCSTCPEQGTLFKLCDIGLEQEKALVKSP